MNNEKNLLSGNGIYKLGYYVTLFGTAVILLWIGLFKFTPTEAAAIRPLLEHHPFTFWVYAIFSVQAVSNVVGTIEITVAVVLLLSVKFYFLKQYAGLGIVFTFLITLSFLFSTPEIWRVKDGVLVTDYFILKDLAYLGFGLMLLGNSGAKGKRKE